MDVSKIIRGIVNSRGYTITSAITQWDYGYVFVPEFEDMPATYRLDFSNDEHHGTALPVYCGSEGGEVPEELIDTGKDIWVWFFYIGDGFGKSEYKWRIPNKCKPRTEQDEPTPSQQSSIDQLIVRSNEAVESAEQSASEASASAQSAQGYAEQAEDARDTAQGYTNNAQTSANNASASAQASANSATASAQSASQSAQIKADVENLADDAQGYASASAQSASASANSASQAQGYAQSASASAQSASGYASSAQTSANTASAKAQDASQSAITASDKATESAQSASQALTYKNDAESAKTASQTAQGLAESAKDSAISAKNDAEDARDDAESARDEAESAVASISGALADKAPVITDSASGAIASFSDGANDLPLKSLIVDINPVQDLHGQDSPYPAGGGANKFDGIMVADGSYLLSANYIPVTEGQTWYIYAPNFPANDYCYGKLYDSNFSEIDAGTTHRIGRNTTYTIPNGVAYIKLRCWGTFDTTNMAFNYPATVTTYSPYENLCPISGWTQVDVNHSDADMTNPTTITIDLGQTVYGGKLDVLSGVLTIDRAMVDLGTLTWAKYNDVTTPVYYAMVSDMDRTRAKAICSQYRLNENWIALNVIPDKTAQTHPSLTYIYFRDDDYLDATAFKSAMSGVQLCYELATPITIQLTPHQVNSLLGVNNLWADSGDTEAVYRADTKLFIERLTAPDSADMVADANITSGKYFMVGNSLYKATANIANGAQIIVGTNCIRKSLSEALNEINA